MAEAAFDATISPLSTETDLDSEDAMISALENAPVGAPMTRRDHLHLLVLGLVVPALILIWGWA